MHRSTRRFLGAPVVLALALTAGLMSTVGPAAAVNPPVVDGLSPMSGAAAGGTPVRIYGNNFTGTTAVKFGAAASPKFRVVDTHLITAVTPAGVNNTFVTVSVTTAGGTGTMTQGYYYTNATLTVTPSTGLVNGKVVTVTLTGYQPNVEVIPVEFNPLLLYIEQFPDFPFGPPPYVDVVGPFPFPRTSATGSLTFTATVTSGSTFVAGTNHGTTYDANVACPANRTTVNFLGTSTVPSGRQPFSGRCHIALSQNGVGAIETPIVFTTDLPQATPTLLLNRTTATRGDVVAVAAGSKYWTANPFFGSSLAATNPGETKTETRICGLGGNTATCSATVGNTAVALTRYLGTANATPPPTIRGTFTGTTLAGSIRVGTDVAPCTTCFVRVRQYRPGGVTYIEKTTPITIT